MSRKTLHPRPPRGGAGLLCPLNLLCVLALTSASCRVYNAELVDDHHIVHFETAGDGSDAAVMNDHMQTSDDTADKLPACGNARVDGTERCDIAIPHGEPGACPQTCESDDPCIHLRLAGQRCAARCESSEITTAADGDGCCPAGASIETDHDCSPSCGNGMVEGKETCDPPSSCPQPETCVSSDACKAGRFTGSPSLCSARCEFSPITACKNDDGCCAPGCTAAQDSDCGAKGDGGGSAAAGSGGASAMSTTTTSTTSRSDAGTCTPETCPAKPDSGTTASSSGTDADPTSCLDVHSGGRCEACDCAYCSDGVTSCLGADDGTACKAVIECAAMHHCTALECLCGVTPISNCERYPLGACRDEILTLAGAFDPLTAIVASTNSSTGIGRAVSVLSCRSDHCSNVCGL